MSSYFDGSTFRAIDALATTDGEGLTSALEAQQASNAEWLHRYDAGQIHKIYPNRDTTNASKGMWVLSSSIWTALHMQPYLVLRGLKSITITWYGETASVDGHNPSVRLELVGVGYQDATWVWSNGDNVSRSITLTLPQASEYEVETDLVLWFRSPPGSTYSGTLRAATITDQRVDIPSGGCLSTTYARGIAQLTSGGYDGDSAPKVLEPLVRYPGQTLASTGFGDVATIVDEVEGSIYAREVSLCSALTRSIMIRTVFE